MGRRMFMKGSPPMGPARFMLRQIINFCGRISKSMLQSATNLDHLKDKELHGCLL